LLLAAERAADLRARSADVDVGDAAVGAVGGHEALSLAHVGGEDRGGKALRHGVVQLDGLVELVVGEHVQNRSERLVVHHRGL